MFPCDVFDQITFVWCFVGTTIKVAHVHLSFSYFWSLLISHFWFWVIAVVEHADKTCCTSLDKVYFIFNISNNNFSQSTLTADIGLMHRVMCSDMLKHNFLSAYINLLSWFQRNWKFAILPLAIYMEVVCIANTQIIDPITVANNMFIVRFMQVTGETEIIKCWSTHEVRLWTKSIK